MCVVILQAGILVTVFYKSGIEIMPDEMKDSTEKLWRQRSKHPCELYFVTYLLKIKKKIIKSIL